jgi:hypothetical protein
MTYESTRPASHDPEWDAVVTLTAPVAVSYALKDFEI